jgi:hypothetical protein
VFHFSKFWETGVGTRFGGPRQRATSQAYPCLSTLTGVARS